MLLINECFPKIFDKWICTNIFDCHTASSLFIYIDAVRVWLKCCFLTFLFFVFNLRLYIIEARVVGNIEASIWQKYERVLIKTIKGDMWYVHGVFILLLIRF